jgi:hypothetical protein
VVVRRGVPRERREHREPTSGANKINTTLHGGIVSRRVEGIELGSGHSAYNKAPQEKCTEVQRRLKFNIVEISIKGT